MDQYECINGLICSWNHINSLLRMNCIWFHLGSLSAKKRHRQNWPLCLEFRVENHQPIFISMMLFQSVSYVSIMHVWCSQISLITTLWLIFGWRPNFPFLATDWSEWQLEFTPNQQSVWPVVRCHCLAHQGVLLLLAQHHSEQVNSNDFVMRFASFKLFWHYRLKDATIIKPNNWPFN